MSLQLSELVINVIAAPTIKISRTIAFQTSDQSNNQTRMHTDKGNEKVKRYASQASVHISIAQIYRQLKCV